MQKEQNYQNIFALVTVMTTILLPLLYLFGYAYELGYLEGYGISNELFPRSIPEYLTSSLLFFLITFSFTAKYSIYILTSIVAIFVVYAILHLAIHKNSYTIIEKIKALFSPHKPLLLCISMFIKELNLNILARPAKFTAWIFLTLYCLLVIMLIVSCLTIAPLFVGKKIAADEIKKFRKCIPEKLAGECISLTEFGNVIASGKLVASSDKYIALYNEGKTIIYSSKEYDIQVK